MRKRLLLVPLLALMLSGCAAKNTIHPGAANQFDSSSYDALVVTDSVIQSTKADLANGKFPVSVAPNVKTALNKLIASYNIADTAYRAYHAAAVAGTPAYNQANDLSSKLQDVNNSTSALAAAKAGN